MDRHQLPSNHWLYTSIKAGYSASVDTFFLSDHYHQSLAESSHLGPKHMPSLQQKMGDLKETMCIPKMAVPISTASGQERCQ